MLPNREQLRGLAQVAYKISDAIEATMYSEITEDQLNMAHSANIGNIFLLLQTYSDLLTRKE